MRPTIGAAYENGLRFQRTFVDSKTKRCSFCALLFQSLSAHKANVNLRKPVRFMLASTAQEPDACEELCDLFALELFWEGLKPGLGGYKAPYREAQSLGHFMVSATLGKQVPEENV